MRIRVLALALVGVSAAAFFWPRTEQTAPITASHTSAAQAPQQDTGSRIFSSKQPVLTFGDGAGLRDIAPSEASPSLTVQQAAPPRVVAREERTGRPVAIDVSARRISSSKPGDAEAREQLVRDIQYELKRAGCYDGDVHGSWNNTTKHAMQTFTQRLNASLPLDQPDYVLLTLLQSQKAQACSKGCPAGQVSAGGGRCLPQAIITQKQGNPRQPVASSLATQPASTLSSTQTPLAGRMGVGAPIAGGSERQDLALDEARRRDQAALEQRSLRMARAGQEDIPLSSQPVPSDRTGLDPQQLGPGPSPEPQAHAAQVRAQPPRQSRPRPAVQRGSTRQVFSNLMRNAP
jgi:hypothetical protein